MNTKIKKIKCFNWIVKSTSWNIACKIVFLDKFKIFFKFEYLGNPDQIRSF